MIKFSGSKWFKIDFHMHTNVSSDYRDGCYTHENWLLKCMEKEIDGVIVSDHNTGKNIDEIKREYERLKNENHQNFRELVIFPAIELTVNGGIHLLVIFEEDKNSSIISRFLGAVDLDGDEGDISTITRKTLTEILDIASQRPYNAICIPAHVDLVKGIFKELQGETLIEVVKNKNIFALEQIDKNYGKPQVYEELKFFHHRVIGSDSHTLEDIAKNYTWLKMGDISLESIKIVLSDKLNRNVICSDEIEENQNPNEFNHHFIKSIEISNGFKIGRGDPIKLNFSPWLNTIIGGRGSGKSTIIKMIQFAFGKNDNGKGDVDFFKIGSRHSKGMLTENIEIFIEFFQYGDIIKIKKTKEKFFIEENEQYIEKDKQTIQELYPIILITQKELFDMAMEQNKLFKFIDKKVNYNDWKRDYDKLISDYYKSKATERSLLLEIKDKQLIEEKLKQVEKILKTYEKYDFVDLIKNHTLYSAQASKLNNAYIKMQDLEKYLENFKTSNLFEDIDFITEDTPNIENFKTSLKNIQKNIEKEIVELKILAEKWKDEWNESNWQIKRDETKQAYENLQKELLEEDRDISGYSEAIKNKNEYIKKLKDIEELEKNYNNQREKSRILLNEIKEKRQKLYDRRKSYINEVNQRLENAYGGEIRVKFDIHYLGNGVESEKTFREAIERTDGKFDSEILLIDNENWQNSTGLLFEVETAQNKEEKVEEIKNKLLNIEDYENDFNGWFVKHIKSILQDKSREDRLLTWFPEDKLEVSVIINGREENIETASPGQKATALMTYIITETDGSLIIDQPEDDLDNRMVTSLIVDGLRNIKNHRQVIIITHNANIPVNASSEQIFEMNYAGGQIQIKEEGTLSNSSIRESICDVMEGGVEALEHRFNKIIKLPFNF